MIKYVLTSDKHLDGGGRPVYIVPIVNPEGAVKYARVSACAQSALVAISKSEDGEVSAELKPGLASKGWALLADEFRADNRERVWDRFVEWMKAGPMCRRDGRAAPWPEKYLPSGVLARRRGFTPQTAAPEPIVIPELDGADEAPAAEALPASGRRRAA